MSRHVVFTVEFLVTYGTGVRFTVQMGGDVMPVEIGGMRVGVITDFAPVRIAFL